MASGRARPHGRGLNVLDRYYSIFSHFHLIPIREDSYFKHVKRHRNKGADRNANRAFDGESFTTYHKDPTDFLKLPSLPRPPDFEFAIVFKTDGGFKNLEGPIAAIGHLAYGVILRHRKVHAKILLYEEGQLVPAGPVESGDAELDAILRAPSLLEEWMLLLYS